MHIIGWLVFGFFVGAISKFLARIITPGKAPRGCLATSLLGIAGSMMGGFLGRFLGNNQETAGWIGSIAGTLVLLALYHIIAPETRD